MSSRKRKIKLLKNDLDSIYHPFPLNDQSTYYNSVRGSVNYFHPQPSTTKTSSNTYKDYSSFVKMSTNLSTEKNNNIKLFKQTSIKFNSKLSQKPQTELENSRILLNPKV